MMNQCSASSVPLTNNELTNHYRKSQRNGLRHYKPLTTPTNMSILLQTTRGTLHTFIRSSHLLALIFVLSLLCHLHTSVASDEDSDSNEWPVDKYPNLKLTPRYCAPGARPLPTSICDPDLILSRYEVQNLDQLLNTVPNNTACICDKCPPHKAGLLIKVAILLAVQQYPNQSLDETVKHYADRIRTKWNFSPTCHHDVLVLLVTTNNKAYISMGAKAERVVDSSQAETIVVDTVRHFQYNNIYQGLESIIMSLQHQASLYDPRLDRLGLRQGITIAILAGLLSLAVIVMLAWICIRKDTKRKRRLMTVNDGTVKSTEYISVSKGV